MYLNSNSVSLENKPFIGLTVTWDVFKSIEVYFNWETIYRLTVTWDVFK